jgi:L-ascorbate metabolism protein UlaG (beta-lactamase superfamily)
VVDRPYTDAEIDAAVAAISHPGRLRVAQDLVLRSAPALQRLLGAALQEGGWFGPGHEQAVREATGREDLGERVREVQTLLAEETRLGMLVGVAVGFELARELGGASAQPADGAGAHDPQSRRTGHTNIRRSDRYMDIRFLGHACFELSDGENRVLIDPFLSGNPKAAASADAMSPTVIALTHGHADHIGDTVAIAKRTGAPVVAIVELAGEIGQEGVQTHDPNLGGTVSFDWGWVRLVPAWHTSTTPKGTVNTPAGLVVSLGGKVVYHLGDTALFSDLQLVGRRDPIDVALMCIGGHYTMDRTDAVEAARLIGARTVIPCHYDTFPPIETDAQAFKSEAESATGSQVVVLSPGETHSA